MSCTSDPSAGGGLAAPRGSICTGTAGAWLKFGDTDTEWSQLGLGASGAPADATYLTQTEDGTLSAEQALASLPTALLVNTTSTGVVTDYAGDGCDPGDFVTDVAADGTLTCDTPAGGGGGTRTFGWHIDGGGSDFATGAQKPLQVPVGGTITKVTLLADTSCATTGDLWNDSFANYQPDNADSITASDQPELSAADSIEETALVSWTTAFAAGSIFNYNVDANTGCGWLTVIVHYTPS
jgi:hypothetical protein